MGILPSYGMRIVGGGGTIWEHKRQSPIGRAVATVSLCVWRNVPSQSVGRRPAELHRVLFHYFLLFMSNDLFFWLLRPPPLQNVVCTFCCRRKEHLILRQKLWHKLNLALLEFSRRCCCSCPALKAKIFFKDWQNNRPTKYKQRVREWVSLTKLFTLNFLNNFVVMSLESYSQAWIYFPISKSEIVFHAQRPSRPMPLLFVTKLDN